MKTDRGKHELRGPVRSVRTEASRLFDSYLPEGQVYHGLYEELQFDSEGRLIEHASAKNYINQDPFRFVYRFDEQGRMVERKGYREDGSGAGTTIYAYDSEGSKTEETFFYSDGQVECHAHYDRRGNVVESAVYQSDGTITMKNTWKYNYKFEGNRVEEEYWHKEHIRPKPIQKDGVVYAAYAPLGLTPQEVEAAAVQIYLKKEVRHRRIIMYDDHGQIIEKVEYSANGDWERKERYNAEGQIIEQGWNGLNKTLFHYNEEGQLMEMNDSHEADQLGLGGFNSKYLFTYDDRGNLVESLWYEADGSLQERITCDYEYDQEGNWTKKIETRKFKTDYESLTEYNRAITYY